MAGRETFFTSHSSVTGESRDACARRNARAKEPRKESRYFPGQNIPRRIWRKSNRCPHARNVHYSISGHPRVNSLLLRAIYTLLVAGGGGGGTREELRVSAFVRNYRETVVPSRADKKIILRRYVLSRVTRSVLSDATIVGPLTPSPNYEIYGSCLLHDRHCIIKERKRRDR